MFKESYAELGVSAYRGCERIMQCFPAQKEPLDLAAVRSFSRVWPLVAVKKWGGGSESPDPANMLRPRACF